MKRKFTSTWPCLSLVLGATTFATWVVGQLFRDQNWATGLCFYLPSPLVAGILIIAALEAWKRSARRTAAVVLLLALGPAIVVGTVENHWTAPPMDSEGKSRIRLVTGMCSGVAGAGAVFERLC
jgi:hypothetical protein